MTLEFIKQYGLNRQSLYGNIPEPESIDAYRQSWRGTLITFPEYRDCPYPTAIVADTMTIGVLVYYIMLTKEADLITRHRAVVDNLTPGAVLEFGIEDLTMRLRRRITLKPLIVNPIMPIIMQTLPYIFCRD